MKATFVLEAQRGLNIQRYRTLFGRRTEEGRRWERVILAFSQWLAGLGISATITLETFGQSLMIADFRLTKSRALLIRLSLNRWHHTYHRRCVKSLRVYVSRGMFRLRSVQLMEAPEVMVTELKRLCRSTMNIGTTDSSLSYVEDLTTPSARSHLTSVLEDAWLPAQCLEPTLRAVRSYTVMESSGG